MWKKFNNNPVQRNVGDCAVRAVSVALDVPWEDAYAMMAANGYQMADMPSSNAVWGSVLRQHGFYREVIPNDCPDCFTAEDFANEHPDGIYVLGFGNHVATVVDGTIYDSWDSRNEIPIYYWYRKEK